MVLEAAWRDDWEKVRLRQRGHWGVCHRHWDKEMEVGPTVGEITWRGDKVMAWSKN